MTDLRCPKCNHLLARVSNVRGVVEIKCRCNHLARFSFGSEQTRFAVQYDWNGLATAAEPHERATSSTTTRNK